MKRAIRVVDGYRRPLLIAMAIPVALVRVLNGAKQGGLMMLPARYFKELPEIPIGAYILLVGATVILCRSVPPCPPQVPSRFLSPRLPCAARHGDWGVIKCRPQKPASECNLW